LNSIAKLINNFNFEDVAIEREVEGDIILNDMGTGLNFKAGSFNGCAIEAGTVMQKKDHIILVVVPFFNCIQRHLKN
jgi:hypothetical protein